MTNTEISNWIDNEESLYLWHRNTRLSRTAFIREHRATLVQAINAVIHKHDAPETCEDRGYKCCEANGATCDDARNVVTPAREYGRIWR